MLNKMLLVILSIGFISFLAIKSGYMGESIDAMTLRFEQAGKVEGGLDGTIWDRYIGVCLWMSLYLDMGWV